MNLPKEIADLHAADKLGIAFVGIQLFQLLSIVEHQGQELVDREGIEIPSRSGSTIAYLHRYGRTSITDLAHFLGMSHQLASHRVKDLKSHGIISEERDPDDGRRTLIALSKTGKSVARKMESICQDTEAEFLILFEETGVDLFDALIKVKSALAERSLAKRISQRHQAST